MTLDKAVPIEFPYSPAPYTSVAAKALCAVNEKVNMNRIVITFSFLTWVYYISKLQRFQMLTSVLEIINLWHFLSNYVIINYLYAIFYSRNLHIVRTVTINEM